ncbi:lipopolysaccharide biosynthesis protein [Shouchella shacheensis]|uniref:lipopolysaccharide biosynthesis protein n=1 Tax=Shouchella shacheensis TaxID=1649580 RepID=UPI0024818AEA|nr:oligosaccharide flippase family protein [Shouchella shacheensis]
MSVLMSGTAIAQILTVASAPILTRLFTPEQFGVLGLYISIISILTVLMTLRYEMAIVLPKNDKEAANLLWLSLIITVFLTVILILVNAILGKKVALILGSPELESWLWLVPFNAFCIGVYNSFNYWCTRNKQFWRLSRSRVVQSLGVVSTQTSGGVIGAGTGGLIGGQFLGQFLASVTLWWQVWKEDRKLITASYNNQEIKKAVKVHKGFPLYNCSQSLINAFSQNAAPFLLAAFFGPSIVGFYSMALRVIKMPMNLVSESFKQVYYQRASEIYNSGCSLNKHLIKATTYLFLIGIIPAILIFLFSPILFSIFLGESWYEAGQYSSWLIIWLFAGLINRPSVATIQILGMQKKLLVYEILLFIVRVITLFLCSLTFSALTGVAVYSLIGALFNILLVFGTIFLVSKKEKVNEHNKT